MTYLPRVYKTAEQDAELEASEKNVSSGLSTPASSNPTKPQARTLAPYTSLCALFVLNLALYGLLELSRHKNISGINSDSNLEVLLPLRTDPQVRLATDSFLNEDCEVAHVVPCVSNDSPGIRRILNGSPPAATQTLLAKYTYSSVENLLQNLSILSKDDDISVLSTNQDLSSLVSFARSWYLEPAFYYILHGREHDAVNEYSRFTAIVQPQILRGHWISVSGIDATDLPVITNLFCVQSDQYLTSICLAGVLRAIAETSPDIMAGVPIGDFLNKYESLDASLQVANLGSYLRVWIWNGLGDAADPPDGLSKPQLAAWHYALGVRLRGAASDLGKAKQQTDCQATLARGVNEFHKAEALSAPDDTFYLPAIHQLAGLQAVASTFCEPPPQGQDSTAETN
jgi:hypothetical protein